MLAALFVGCRPVVPSLSVSVMTWVISAPPPLGRASDADHSARKEGGRVQKQVFQGHAATFDHFRWRACTRRDTTGQDQSLHAVGWAWGLDSLLEGGRSAPWPQSQNDARPPELPPKLRWALFLGSVVFWGLGGRVYDVSSLLWYTLTAVAQPGN